MPKGKLAWVDRARPRKVVAAILAIPGIASLYTGPSAAQTVLERVLTQLPTYEVTGIFANAAEAGIDGRDVARITGRTIMRVTGVPDGASAGGVGRLILPATATSAIAAINSGSAIVGLSVRFGDSDPSGGFEERPRASVGLGAKLGLSGAGTASSRATAWRASVPGSGSGRFLTVNIAASRQHVDGRVQTILRNISSIAGNMSGTAIGVVNDGSMSAGQLSSDF